jgi:hypothetical protein
MGKEVEWWSDGVMGRLRFLNFCFYIFSFFCEQFKEEGWTNTVQSV